MTDFSAVYTLIWTDIPEDIEDKFNHWYDTEHLRDRLAIPGIVKTSRYRALTGTPKYIAFHKAADRSVLSSAPYIALRAKPDPHSSQFIPHFANTIRAILSTKTDVGTSNGAFAAFHAMASESSASIAEMSEIFARDLPHSSRLRLMFTVPDLMAEQRRSLAQSPRAKMRPPERVPAGLVLLECDRQSLLETVNATLAKRLQECAEMMSAGTFQRITMLQRQDSRPTTAT